MKQNRKIIKVYQKDNDRVDTILKLLLKYMEIKREQKKTDDV